jgi:uncharacterized protein YjbK
MKIYHFVSNSYEKRLHEIGDKIIMVEDNIPHAAVVNDLCKYFNVPIEQLEVMGTLKLLTYKKESGNSTIFDVPDTL